MYAESQNRLTQYENQLSIIPISLESENPIIKQITSLQNQILAIPTGFTNTGSAARREADNNINLRTSLQNQIESLKLKLKEPLNIPQNNKDQLGQQTQNPINSGLILVGGVVLAAIILK